MDIYTLILANHIIVCITIIIGIINIIILGKLVKFYKETYAEIESKFTIGLLYFSRILLIGNILVVLALICSLIGKIEMDEIGGIIVYLALLIINLSELIAFNILKRITLE
jgi:hypothetical protein